MLHITLYYINRSIIMCEQLLYGEMGTGSIFDLIFFTLFMNGPQVTQKDLYLPRFIYSLACPLKGKVD